MIDRIFYNWKTTLLGLGLIIAALLFVWFEKATLAEASGFMAVGMLAVFAKDPQKPSIDE